MRHTTITPDIYSPKRGSTKSFPMFMRSLAAVALLALSVLAVSGPSAAQEPGKANPAAGAGNIIVHPRFGGLIFGFDIDPNGGEGILSEAAVQNDGTIIAAVETFDPTTGAILKTVAKTQGKDDFVALPVQGDSIGLIEREHVVSLFDVRRSFDVLDPLNGNRFTGSWTAPLPNLVLAEIKRSSTNTKSAVLAVPTTLDAQQIVFSTDVGANTFGPIIPVVDVDFDFEAPPVLAYDGVRNQAILGHNTNSPFLVPPKIAVVDLSTGSFRKFTGLGIGVIDGIAIDSADRIICTDTSFDGGVQFYNLTTNTRVSHILPGVTQTDDSSRGQHIEYDPVNKLFLIAQQFSSTRTGSSIVVYDTQGNFVESVNGLNFTGTSNVFPVHIALNPSQRTGFVDGPDLQVRTIQSFTY